MLDSNVSGKAGGAVGRKRARHRTLEFCSPDLMFKQGANSKGEGKGLQKKNH